MNYKIIGDNLQIVEIELESGESVYSESGTMKYMSESITMDTNTKGGLLKGLKRSFSGDTLFITNFKSEDKKGTVAFGGTFPGKIIPLDILSVPEIIANTPQRCYYCKRAIIRDRHFFVLRMM